MNTMTPTAAELEEPRFDHTASAEAREVASREAARIGEKAREWWQRNARTTLDLADTVKDEAAAVGDRTRLYVRDEPMRSVLVAAAAGALVTGLLMLFGRRSR
jgi:ElaB/YqjD/DUF883 family membrane-anchored ribosome-binding protein